MFFLIQSHFKFDLMCRFVEIKCKDPKLIKKQKAKNWGYTVVSTFY